MINIKGMRNYSTKKDKQRIIDENLETEDSYSNNLIHNKDFSIFDLSGENFYMPQSDEHNKYEEELFPKSEMTNNSKQKQYFRIPKLDKKQLKMILSENTINSDESENRYLSSVMNIQDSQKPAVPSISVNNSSIKNLGVFMLPKISSSNSKINAIEEEVKEKESEEILLRKDSNDLIVQNYIDSIQGFQAKKREKDRNNVETNFVSKNGRNVMFSKIAQKPNLLINTENDEEVEENSSFYSNPSIFNVTNEVSLNKNFCNISTINNTVSKIEGHSSLIPVSHKNGILEMSKTKNKTGFKKWEFIQNDSKDQLFPSNL